MGLSSALNTSLNGLRLNETKIDVIGNNIANADTTGFKSSNVQFQTQLFRNLGIGSAPTAENGGTNPRQVGLGASVASIAKDFSQGAVTATTSPSDLAIQGDGFFVLESVDGVSFTRAGQFRLNSQNELVDPQGFRVLGYGIDEQGRIDDEGERNPLTVQLGEVVNVAQETTEVELAGALLPFERDGESQQPAIIDLVFDAGFADTDTLASLTSGGTAAFPGAEVTFEPIKGSRSLEPRTIPTTATVQEFRVFMEETLGLPSGSVTLTNPPGSTTLTVSGQSGESNGLVINTQRLTSGGASGNLTITQQQQAEGEGGSVDVEIFDSLGQKREMTIKVVLDAAQTTSSESIFRWYVESPDNVSVTPGGNSSRLVGEGELRFDSFGELVDVTTITRDATGAVVSNPSLPTTGSIVMAYEDTAANSPVTINLDFAALAGVSNEEANQPNVLSLKQQNGASAGTLTTFAIDDTGVVNGILDNGLVTQLGQLALARFRNTEGLVEQGGNRYSVGPGSGEPTYLTPGDFGAGTILSGAIELSNTDIGKSLVDLIVASTNYRGNARVISSVNELVDELLILGR